MHIALDWPLASQVIGEVQPRQTQQRGERTTFTLSLQPQFQSDNRGFDQVLVVLPSGAAVDLEEVVVGAERVRYGPEEVTRVRDWDRFAVGAATRTRGGGRGVRRAAIFRCALPREQCVCRAGGVGRRR